MAKITTNKGKALNKAPKTKKKELVTFFLTFFFGKT